MFTSRFRAAVVWALVLVSGSSLATGVSAQAAPRRDAVRALLSGFEEAPSAAEWEALGPGAVAVLTALHDDAAEAPFIRLRTVWAARFYRTAASRAFLERVLLEEGLTRRAAVLALADAFGADSIPTVAPFLADPDVAVREGTITALRGIDDARSREALRARLAIEPDGSLQVMLRAALEH